MTRLRAILSVLSTLAFAACSLSKPNPAYCERDTDCPSGSRCKLDSPMKNSCVATDGGAGDGGTDGRTDGGDASDVPGPECTSSAQCTTAGRRVCDTAAGMCVACLGNGDCSGTTPICESRMCRGCKADTECGTDPGVCLSDGHCATSGEVVFVEFKSAGCPGADGTTTMPFCTPNEGAAALTATRRVLLIRGPADGRLALGTTGIAPVIVGKRNSSAEEASIPATAATGIAVSADDVLIRDLGIISGSSASSKGIVVSGASTKLSLLRVRVALVTGLGVEANGGAELRMDRCVVENNSVGGLRVDGSRFDITNSVVSSAGYGVRFSTPLSGSRFLFNTVLSATATICDLTSPPMLESSIIVGTNADCILVNSITTMPSFSATRPYHLTGSLGCPSAPAATPEHDIDGEPRTAPVDCGADEFVP